MMTDENYPFLESENKLVEPKQVIDDWKAQEKAQSAPYLGNQCHQVHLGYLSLDLNCHFRVGNVQIMDAPHSKMPSGQSNSQQFEQSSQNVLQVGVLGEVAIKI